MPTIFGKPSIVYPVLRADARQRPAARNPSLDRARGFPTAFSTIKANPLGPAPTEAPSPPIALARKTVKRRHANAPLATGIRTSDCPRLITRRGSRRITEAAFIARARLNTGLTP
jgi:hypothetical protein